MRQGHFCEASSVSARQGGEMHTKICGTSRAPLLTLLLFLVSLGFAVYLNARPPAQDASKPVAEQEKVQTAASAAASGDYVGSATCKTCHDDMPSKSFYKNFEDSPHFVNHAGYQERPRVARLRGLPRAWQSSHGRRRKSLSSLPEKHS